MKTFYTDFSVELTEALNCTRSTYKGKDISADQAMDIWADETHRIAQNNGTIFLAGNGASATMAEHFGTDAMKNGKLKTINFSETSYLTAISNDISYDAVFLLKLERFGNPGDMLITISSSGNSPNIVNAIKYAKENKIFCTTLSAMKPDNRSRKFGDLAFYVPAKTYGIAESAHSAVLHCWLDTYLDKYLGGRQ
ncbi:MAG: SIS domain-containing protein [Desulfatitalea sp.]|nr:SIS domain-containing protein [Desulfatitalea sp.]